MAKTTIGRKKSAKAPAKSKKTAAKSKKGSTRKPARAAATATA